MSASGPPQAAWKRQRERGNAFWIGLLAWIATRLGRGVALFLLWPITLFFLLVGGAAARRASRDYLRRVLGRAPRAMELWRHTHTFATCTLDRLLILCGRGRQLQVTAQVPEPLQELLRDGGGCMLLVSHVGSFEVLRQLGERGLNRRLRILLDRSRNPLVTGMLERLNPEFASAIIDAGQRGPELVLALREALDAGCHIGIMADRAGEAEPVLPVRFLGGSARLPAGPWIMASVLHAPVIAAFCVFRGGKDYQASFELLTPGIRAGRAERHAAMQAGAQRYADLLERILREAPYNWFNFYDYWTDETPAG